MLVDKLQELHHAEPFRPFIIHLADGRRVRVGRPEWMGFTPPGHVAHVCNKDGSTNDFQCSLITHLEVLPNSKKRKARAA